MKGKLSSYNDVDFINLVSISDSYSDLKRRLGYTTTSGGVAILIKKRVLKLGLDTSHFTRARSIRIQNIGKSRYTLEEILVKYSEYSSNDRLKRRLVSSGLLKYECGNCKNQGEWCGQKLSLQLDHKNGINNDNRLKNLRFLCPNCHSQTDSFSGRNKESTAKMVD